DRSPRRAQAPRPGLRGGRGPNRANRSGARCSRGAYPRGFAASPSRRTGMRGTRDRSSVQPGRTRAASYRAADRLDAELQGGAAMAEHDTVMLRERLREDPSADLVRRVNAPSLEREMSEAFDPQMQIHLAHTTMLARQGI